MIYYKLNFNAIPKVIFAHNFTQFNYSKTFDRRLPNIEIVYIKSGSITVETNSIIEHIKEGSIFVLFHKNHLNLKADENTLHIHYTINFRVEHDIEIIKDIGSYTLENGAEMLVPMYIEPCDETEALSKKLMEVIDEYNNHDVYYKYKCSAMAIGLLTDISRISRKHLYTTDKHDAPSQYVLCYKIKTYIAQNISKNISLKELSTAFNKTPNYLNSIFKNVNNVTIKQYINKEKISKVIELMLNRKTTLKEAGEYVGIYDPNYLSRMFKHQTGMSASQYTHNARENTASIVDRTLL